MRLLAVILTTSWVSLAAIGVASAQTRPEFGLGFKALADQIPDVVGEPLENERHDPTTGDGLQQTTGGLMVWHKADNRTAFTDGYWTWISGPVGVQKRGNEERLAWESGGMEPSSSLAARADVLASWLRGLITPIPHIGGSLEAILTTKDPVIARERIGYFVSSLQAELATVPEDMVDREYLESEEWTDLVIKALDASFRTRQREGIRLYARIIRAAIVVQNRAEWAPEEYLEALSELSPREMEVATAIFRQQQDPAMKPRESELGWAMRMGWDRLPEDCPSIPKDDLPFILARLQRTGLIREITGTYYDYAGGVYVITESFRKLVRHVGPLGGT